MYTIIPIPDFEKAKAFAPHCDWCICQAKFDYDTYTLNGETFYFCLKEGFEKTAKRAGDNYPYDDYGVSMLAISVTPDGQLANCTNRWNEDRIGNPNVSEQEISDLIGTNFQETFKPSKPFTDIINNAADELLTSLSDYEVCVNYTKHNFDKIKEEVQHRINEKLGILGLQGASIDITDIQLDSKIGRSTLWEWAKRMDKIDKEEKIEPFISLFQSEFYKYQTRQYPIQMKHEIIEIDKTSELFPRSLIEIGDDCPEKLYLMGNVELLKAEKSVAIIGARAADRNGCSKAYSLAVDFTKKGYVVVSGLALGCDSSAHRGCLDAMGKTIAIVGSGLDIVHPQENVPLQERILQRQGLVLSE